MSEENKIELGNCPFCGSSRIEQISFNLGALVQLECNGCRLKTPRFSSTKTVSNFWNTRADNPRITKLETENEEIERLESAEKALLDAIADWYYLHPNPKADEVLSKQYENFLTFGQGGANFSEAQDLAEEAI